MHMDRERERRASPPAITISIDFRGDPLLGVLTDRGAFVAVDPLVRGMGLDGPAQHRRLQRDPILSEAVTWLPIDPERNVLCLPLDRVPGFLFGIDPARVAVAVRGRVLAYQRDCYRVLVVVLFRHYGALPADCPTPVRRPAAPRSLLKLRLLAVFWTAVAFGLGAYVWVLRGGRRG